MTCDSELVTSDSTKPRPTEARMSNSSNASTEPMGASIGTPMALVMSTTSAPVIAPVRTTKATYLPVSSSSAETGATRSSASIPSRRSAFIDRAPSVRPRCWTMSASTATP